jgi:hypothetical protein
VVPKGGVKGFEGAISPRGTLHSQLSPLLGNRYRQLRPAGCHGLPKRGKGPICGSPAATPWEIDHRGAAGMLGRRVGGAWSIVGKDGLGDFLGYCRKCEGKVG